MREEIEKAQREQDEIASKLHGVRASAESGTCECDLRHRRWNPVSGRCETCGQSCRRSPIAREIVVSAPGAAATVTRLELTEEAKRSLITGVDKLPPPRRQ
jgi:hypothetical protein